MAESDDCFYNRKVPQLEDKLVDIDKEIRKETINSDTLLIQLNELKAEIDNYEGSQDIIYYYYRMQFHIRMKELCSHRGDETNSQKHDRNHLKYLNQFEEAFQASENQSSTPSIETVNEQEFEVINDDIDFVILIFFILHLYNDTFEMCLDFAKMRAN